MFKKRSWLHRGRIESDEGFSIVVSGRDTVIYREGGRAMPITVDIGPDGFTIFLTSIGRWNDDPVHAVGEQKKRAIADNVRRALASQGQKVDFA